MNPTKSDAIGINGNTPNPQAGNHHDTRQDPDAGRSQSTQQLAPTVRVDNARQKVALTAQDLPPQQEPTNQFVPGAPPGQFSASQPVLRGPVESVESAHGSGNVPMDAPDNLALQGPGLPPEKGSEPGMVQATLDKDLSKDFSSELSAWVKSADETKRDAYQSAQNIINTYMEAPEARRYINFSGLGLSSLPPLPADLIELDVCRNNLTALPGHLLQNLRSLSVQCNPLKPETLIAFMRSNTSITELDFDRFGTEIDTDTYNEAPSEVYPDVFFDELSTQALDLELVYNKEHPARLLKAAVTLDLLTRLALTTSDQTGTLIKRDSTPNPVVGQLPSQPIPAELHNVLAANCPKDVLAVLAGMVNEVGDEPLLQNGC